jgi:opacity protein-like surface antigen
MVKNCVKITVLLIFALSLVTPGQTAFSWEKGSLKIVPSLKFEEKWDSNVFYDTSDEKSDFISILTPGIAAEAGFGKFDKHKAFVDYHVDLGMFAKYNDQNYGNHDLYGGVDLDFNKYSLKTTDHFLFTSSRAGTDLDRRVLRKENTIKTVFTANWNKMSWDVGYSNYIIDYLSDTLKGLDRYDNSIWTTGYIEIRPKTQVLFEYKYRNIYYPSTAASGRDGNANSAMVGLRGIISPKVTGIIKGGFKYQDYKNGQDFAAPIAEVGLEYKPTDRIDVNFSYLRDAIEATYTGGNYYAADHFLADLKYDLGKNWLAKVSGKYQHNAYDKRAVGVAKKREDNIFGVGCGLEYKIKEWCLLDAGYYYTQRASNIDTRDYDQHVISSSIKVMF